MSPDAKENAEAVWKIYCVETKILPMLLSVRKSVISFVFCMLKHIKYKTKMLFFRDYCSGICVFSKKF